MGTERKVTLGPRSWNGQDPLVLAMVTIRNKRPLGQNVSTSAVSLPNFIVIKVPETVAAPHISVALSLPWFLSVPHPSKYSHFVGKKKPRASVNVSLRAHSSGKGFPGLAAMIVEAACRAEREVKVVKGNESLEGCPTTPAASSTDDCRVGDLRGRGSQLGS